MRASSLLRLASASALSVLLAAAPSAAGAHAAVPAAPSASAAQSGDVTWTVRTESNRLGADRTSFTYTLNPGATIQDGLVVANHGDQALDLAVYAADGYTTDSGQFDVLVAGADSAGIGAWLHADVDRVAVAPGGSATIPFTVTVPEKATPGDYAGGVITSLGAEDDEAGVSVDRRLGIRIDLRVAGELTPALAVEDARVDWQGGLNPFATGDATLTYTLHNTGNTLVTSQESATVAGPFGWFARDAGEIAAPPRLLPGESWTQRVAVHDVGALFVLTATAIVIPVVTDAAGTTAPLEPVTATAAGWAVPWVALGILVLAGLAAFFIVRRILRQRAKRKEQEDARIAEAVDRALAHDRRARERDGAPDDAEIPVP
ncbi:WxL protein peptidoglycan domain-containing protein [Microbacterium timonense]|uniref:WxL protein peptidoglycan domain-containing protein n=1 Tax=Microbacterium timonense TaxID=2086576 RepID=UPI000D0FBD99|nr:DUF916 domain-containing protein [Microbacterium timonense]